MVRQAHLIAVVGILLIGCAVLAAHSRGAAAEEGRCEGTRQIDLMSGAPVRQLRGLGANYATNDVPGCPKGGLLLGTDGPNTDINTPIQDYLYGGDGEDEVRGLGANDELWGGLGSDVIYGGPGFDIMWAGAVRGPDKSNNKLYGGDGPDDVSGADGEDVLYGGDGNDWVNAADGEDVLYGGDGNDTLYAASNKDDLGADKLYCGAGTDKYEADPTDYVSSSCEKGQLWEDGKLVDTGGPPLILLAGAVLLLGSGLAMSRYTTRRVL